MDTPCLVSVGKVGGAHGLQGAVKIVAYGESFGSLKRGDKLSLKPGTMGEPVRELTLVAATPHGRAWLAQFEEILDRETARAMVGREILIEEDRLPPLNDGEYYYYQLIGLSVERVDGTALGTLTSIIEAGSHDVYVVRDGEKEFLIPAVEEVIREIDLQGRRVVIDPPEGLLE